jgi:hypothetical protein
MYVVFIDYITIEVPATVFLASRINEKIYQYLVSVCRIGHSSRAVVTFEGPNTGEGGRWSCNKDSGGACFHIEDAKCTLTELLSIDMSEDVVSSGKTI